MKLFSFLFPKNKIIRTTQEAETFREMFRENYEIFTRVENSGELKRFLELEEYVNSPLFKKRRKEIESLSYKDSEYFKIEKKYKSYLKQSKLQAYNLIKNSPELQGYLKVTETDLYREFAKLRVIVMSASFDRKLHAAEYDAYKKLIKEPKIEALVKFEKNRKFKYYNEIAPTQLPREFEELTGIVKSDDFKKKREYLLNKKRYLTTDDYKLLCEYEELKKRPDITKYTILYNDSYFNAMRKWELAFEDDFDSGRLDTNKWITRYYAGERFLDDTYGVGHDVQLFTNDNVSFKESAVCLNFRKEAIIGKYWDRTYGIKERKYEYTSAMLSTACSFKQRYGRFEAKIKLNKSDINQCFWMLGDTEMPHVEIMKSKTSGVYMGNVYSSRNASGNTVRMLKDIDLSNEYYIFTLEWTQDKLVWMVNDLVVKEVNENIPDVPMYIVLSLSAHKTPSDKDLPGQMEVDWIRLYKIKS